MAKYRVVLRKSGFNNIVKVYSSKREAMKSVRWHNTRGWKESEIFKVPGVKRVRK